MGHIVRDGWVAYILFYVAGKRIHLNLKEHTASVVQPTAKTGRINHGLSESELETEIGAGKRTNVNEIKDEEVVDDPEITNAGTKENDNQITCNVKSPPSIGNLIHCENIAKITSTVKGN